MESQGPFGGFVFTNITPGGFIFTIYLHLHGDCSHWVTRWMALEIRCEPTSLVQAIGTDSFKHYSTALLVKLAGKFSGNEAGNDPQEKLNPMARESTSFRFIKKKKHICPLGFPGNQSTFRFSFNQTAGLLSHCIESSQAKQTPTDRRQAAPSRSVSAPRS